MSASAPSSKPVPRASSRPSSPASAIPAWTAAPPATWRPTIRASPATRSRSSRIPYSAAMGDVQRNGRWERRHKFADFGCTVCHDGQGRGLETKYSHGEDEFWPEPLTGYVTQATWRKDFAPKLKSKDYMEANCAQCHTRGELRRHAQRQSRPQTLLRHELLWLPQNRRHERRHPRARSHRGRQEVQDRLPLGIDRRAARQSWTSSFMPKFNLPEADVQVPGDLPQEPARRQFRRDLARSLQGPHRKRRRGDSARNRRRKGRRATDHRPRLHRLPQTAAIATAASRPT